MSSNRTASEPRCRSYPCGSGRATGRDPCPGHSAAPVPADPAESGAIHRCRRMWRGTWRRRYPHGRVRPARAGGGVPGHGPAVARRPRDAPVPGRNARTPPWSTGCWRPGPKPGGAAGATSTLLEGAPNLDTYEAGSASTCWAGPGTSAATPGRRRGVPCVPGFLAAGRRAGRSGTRPGCGSGWPCSGQGTGRARGGSWPRPWRWRAGPACGSSFSRRTPWR
jgi:translation initiation factor IF-2